MSFHAADFAMISLSWADGTPEPTVNGCEQWKGRKVKVWFSATPGKEYAGEITMLLFFGPTPLASAVRLDGCKFNNFKCPQPFIPKIVFHHGRAR